MFTAWLDYNLSNRYKLWKFLDQILFITCYTLIVDFSHTTWSDAFAVYFSTQWSRTFIRRLFFATFELLLQWKHFVVFRLQLYFWVTLAEFYILCWSLTNLLLRQSLNFATNPSLLLVLNTLQRTMYDESSILMFVTISAYFKYFVDQRYYVWWRASSYLWRHNDASGELDQWNKRRVSTWRLRRRQVIVD